MRWILSIGVPVIACLLMFVVGLGLRVTDFRRVLMRPRAVLGGILGQLLCIPLAAVAVSWMFSLEGATLSAVLLLAACPAGGISNYYTYLARASTALSVSLTAVSILAAVVTMPTVLAVFEGLTGTTLEYHLPFQVLAAQLLGLIALPVALGVAIGTVRPVLARRYEPVLRVSSWGLLACLIALVIVDHRTVFMAEFARIAPVAGSLMICATLAGIATAVALRLNADEVLTLAIEFPARNIAVATVTAVTILGRLDFAVFAAVYLLVELIVVTTLVSSFRIVQRLRPRVTPPTPRRV